jgi:alpha-tubulin suppressor-like RCC1 family protein
MACANADTPATQLSQAAAEEAVLCLINEQRLAVGSPALAFDPKLRAAARAHAEAAATLKWWAGGGPPVHVNPQTGSTPASRIKAAGYCQGVNSPPTNENCYAAYYRGGPQYQTGTTPRAAVTWWMNSQDHRTTLLDPVYRESGVGVVPGVAEIGPEPDRAEGGRIFVQTFGSCSLPKVGEGWAWGFNVAGQLGDDTTTNRLTPVRPQGLSGATAGAAGGSHSLALKADGRVWAWGNNQRGQLGDGSTTRRLTPVQVASLADVKAVAAGFGHSLALKNDGSVWAWGDNEWGQLGDGSTTDRHTPVQVANLGEVDAIAAGFGHSLALTRDGRVWAWGANTSGQLGDATLDDRLTPVRVKMSPALAGVVVGLAAGGVHSLALEQDGRVWTWGGNAYGQLGNGDTTDRWLPVRPVRVEDVVALAGGFGQSLALKIDGSVWAWGSNEWGELGDDTTTPRLTRVQVLNLGGVLRIAAGFFHSLALTADGSVWAWGDNHFGCLGDNTTTGRRVPVQVQNLVGAFAISGGHHHSLGLAP